MQTKMTTRTMRKSKVVIVIKKILLVRDIGAGWRDTNYREIQVMLTFSKKDGGECSAFSVSDGVNTPSVKFPLLATPNVFEEKIQVAHLGLS